MDHQHFGLDYVEILAQTLSANINTLVGVTFLAILTSSPWSKSECLEGDRVNLTLVLAAESIRVKLVWLRPVCRVIVKANLKEFICQDKDEVNLLLTVGM